MTDEVGRLVLRNNYLQTLALSLAERRGPADLGFAQRLMQSLERQGRLDRGGRVPARRCGARRARDAAARRSDAAGARGAARLCQALAARRAARQPRCRTIPISDASSSATSRSRCASASRTRSRRHRLRREIIATQLANAIVNRGGPTIVDAARRPDRRRRADHRGGLRGDARLLRPDRAQRRDRRARRDGARRPAAPALWRAAGPPDEPPRLVHPQRRLRERLARGASCATTAPASRRSRRA